MRFNIENIYLSVAIIEIFHYAYDIRTSRCSTAIAQVSVIAYFVTSFLDIIPMEDLLALLVDQPRL